MRFVTMILTAVMAIPMVGQGPVRVGLSTEALEHQVRMEGGGSLQTRRGEPLFELRSGETIRIWLDARGETNAVEGYRVQVGPPLTEREAEALMAQLRALGERPERVSVSDGGTWRVLTGWFEHPAGAEPTLRRLEAAGFEELWVASEKRPEAPPKGRALYAITERYERLPLPRDGVRFLPKGEATWVQGKGHYRGWIEIFPNAQGRLTVVNEVPLETYLRGVVPKEMGAWQYPALEALKAQAVAARTYAVANRGKRAKEGFDLLDTVADQVYGGRDAEQSLTDQAIEATRGLIATHGGKPIQALFMANGGGHTVDNRFVFGGGATPYLKAASNYLESPTTLRFTGVRAPSGDQSWLTPRLLSLAAVRAIPVEWLTGERLAQPARGADVQAPLDVLWKRLVLARPKPGGALPGDARGLVLGMARSLGFEALVQGMERPHDGRYFLGTVDFPEADLPLAAFLVRRGIVSPDLWQRPGLTLGQALEVLARLWGELEALPWVEGTLLRDGNVRVKQGGPGPLPLLPERIVVEEAPGGALRWVSHTMAQVGDRLRWLPTEEGGSRILIRRLDPDGASMDRYNPLAHWREEIRESDLLQSLKRRAGIDSLESLELVHNEHGRVLELIVRDGAGRPHRFTGMRIRSLLGLKDNVFRMIELGRRPERRWIVYGRGWGHGVGMDQTGAYGYALEGWTFDRILRHYYQGIELTPIGP